MTKSLDNLNNGVKIGNFRDRNIVRLAEDLVFSTGKFYNFL